MRSKGIISAYNPSLGFGIVDALRDDGTTERYEITHTMLPEMVAGLRAGQEVWLRFDGEQLKDVEPASEAPAT